MEYIFTVYLLDTINHTGFLLTTILENFAFKMKSSGKEIDGFKIKFDGL